MPPSLPEACRRWAELLRRIFEVHPLRLPVHDSGEAGAEDGRGMPRPFITFL